MSFSEILLIAFGVSIDAAAVSVSGSLCPGKYTKRHCAFNAALLFGSFQFFMPLAGFYLAAIFSGIFEKFDHYIAFFLLLFVGGKMIYEACSKTSDNNRCTMNEFFSFGNLILPAIATSVDALAIGAGLAFSNCHNIWLPASAMGLITALMSAFCVILGKKIANSAQKYEKCLSIIGGIVIIAIGIKIFAQDLMN